MSRNPIRWFSASALALALVSAAAVAVDCTLTELGLVPLNDLGADEFLVGHIGGLYPGGKNTRPAPHLDAGLDIATNEVVPRSPIDPNDEDSACIDDPVNGRIGLISIGMCNTSEEFDVFTERLTGATPDAALDDKVVLVNGAQGGMTASDWANAGENEDPWLELQDRVIDAGLHRCQVQVVWVKQAEARPGTTLGAFPTHAEVLRDDIEAIVTKLVTFYPNVRLCYLSSRTRAYTDVVATLNPEPFAYESAFSVRWLIEKQLNGDLPFDTPTAVAPWLSWGPYLWSDGEAGRSDGFQWLCTDVESSDFTHPSDDGAQKVADQLIAFFKTDATTRPWFLEDVPIGNPPTVSVTPSVAFGPAPLTVDFTSAAFDPDGGAIEEYAWTFDDGGFAYGAGADAPSAADAQKTFPVPGRYTVTLTVADQDGDWASTTAVVHVTNSASDKIEAEADATVRDGAFANSNFGLTQFLAVSFGGGAANIQSHLRFDLSPIPATSRVVTLNLTSRQLPGSAQTVSAFSVADDSWSETGITWNTQPPAGAELDARYIGGVGVLYRFDVTDFVLAELALGETKASFVLAIETPDMVQVQFSSRESADAPFLEFEHGKDLVRRR